MAPLSSNPHLSSALGWVQFGAVCLSELIPHTRLHNRHDRQLKRPVNIILVLFPEHIGDTESKPKLFLVLCVAEVTCYGFCYWDVLLVCWGARVLQPSVLIPRRAAWVSVAPWFRARDSCTWCISIVLPRLLHDCMSISMAMDHHGLVSAGYRRIPRLVIH